MDGALAAALALSGNDSLLSIVQMPRGVPVATVAIHNAANAGLLAVRTLGAAESALRRGREFFFFVIALFWRWCLGAADPTLRRKMAAYMESQEAEVLGKADKLEKGGFPRAYLDGA